MRFALWRGKSGLLCGSAIKEECRPRLAVCRWRHCIAKVHTRLALFLDGPASALRVWAQVCCNLLAEFYCYFHQCCKYIQYFRFDLYNASTAVGVMCCVAAQGEAAKKKPTGVGGWACGAKADALRRAWGIEGGMGLRLGKDGWAGSLSGLADESLSGSSQAAFVL
ncbi:MAG: hypothetical protein LBE30_13970 [Comamonas sp.]|jgi:hypothetical protein|nr:hypothetical protein [Comamonas sp.]